MIENEKNIIDSETANGESVNNELRENETKNETEKTTSAGEVAVPATNNDATPVSGNTETAERSFGIAYMPQGSNAQGMNGNAAGVDETADGGYRYVSYGATMGAGVGGASGGNAGGNYNYNANFNANTNANGYANANANAYASANAYANAGVPAAAPQKTKKKKARSGKNGHLAAVLSCVVVACVLLSGLAAFGGTFVANRLAGSVPGGSQPDPTQSSGGTVQMLQSSREVETLKVDATGKLMSVAETAALVKSSVVEIVTETIENSSYLGQYVLSGAGSGVIVSSDGYIITNHHVIDGATKITVRLTDGSEYEAALIGSDELADIAVIKIKPAEGVTLSVAVLGDSDKLVVGEAVIAIGNPLGELGGTVTDGIVSALDREVTVDGKSMNLLQTNAAINPGNSGGGLFNLYGELVGIVNAKYSSTGVEGLGFVIPINNAKSVSEQLIQYGYVRGRPALGITVYDADVYTAWRYYGSTQAGAYIESADESTGLQRGDRVISIDENEIGSASDISNYINTKAVGDSVSVVVMRRGKTVQLSITLKEKVPETAQNSSN